MNGFQLRREQKKQSILEAALELFMEQGVQGTSVSQIAKQARVSQVTIYNYFDNKHKLVEDVFTYYIDKATAQVVDIVRSGLSFPEKVKQLIYMKKDTANRIHQELYQEFMKYYSSADPDSIRNLFHAKALPLMIELFNEGRQKGYIDPNLSNEAIIIYMMALSEYLQREEVYSVILPLTEDMTNLMFYGIMGKRE